MVADGALNGVSGRNGRLSGVGEQREPGVVWVGHKVALGHESRRRLVAVDVCRRGVDVGGSQVGECSGRRSGIIEKILRRDGLGRGGSRSVVDRREGGRRHVPTEIGEAGAEVAPSTAGEVVEKINVTHGVDFLSALGNASCTVEQWNRWTRVWLSDWACRQVWRREGVGMARIKRRPRRWHALPTTLLRGLVRLVEEYEVRLGKGGRRCLMIRLPLGE